MRCSVVSLSCLPLGGRFSSFVSVCLSLLPRIYNLYRLFIHSRQNFKLSRPNFLIAHPALHFAPPSLDTHSTEQLIALEREIDVSFPPFHCQPSAFSQLHQLYSVTTFTLAFFSRTIARISTTMATANAPNPRASLLAGLRTGGVRSASANVPQTAAPGASSFNIPRIVTPQNEGLYTQEEEDELPNMMAQNMYIRNNAARIHQHPMTAAVDGAANRFAQQQHTGMMSPGMNFPMTPGAAQTQLQTLQLQMMQMEIARLQNIQAQQYQAELLAQAQAQAQRQRQAQQPMRRTASAFVPPATAGPAQGSFNLHAGGMDTQMRRASQADQLRSRLGVGSDDQVPMTAALGGKFGSRVASGRYDSEEDDFSNVKLPSTPNFTTVISGGTSLGTPTTGTLNTAMPSKSDAAVSWRRNGTNNSVLSGNRAASSPVVRITPPPVEAGAGMRSRPIALQLAASQPFPGTVVIDTSDGADADDSSSASSKSNSSPSTPHSASSTDVPPLSPREDAVKKLYEGLGIGRPIPTITVAEPQDTPIMAPKVVCIPLRQPRGPPSNNDELKPKNFATRSRRKALGALMDARERRELVEAF